MAKARSFPAGDYRPFSTNNEPTSRIHPSALEQMSTQGLLNMPSGGSPSPSPSPQGAPSPQGQPQSQTQGRSPNAYGFGDAMLQLSAGLAGMSQRPNQAVQNMALGQLEQRSNARATEKQANATADWLEKNGQVELSQAVRSGAISGKDALAMMQGGEAPASFKALELRAQAMGLQKGTKEYNDFMLNAGAPRAGNNITVNNSLSDSQSGAANFLNRMYTNNAIISQFESEGTKLGQALLAGVPIVGNMLTSDEYRQYNASKNNWIAAQLRKESGAAIGADEYETADKQYFAQPGDDPQTIANKRDLRKQAQIGMGLQAGAYGLDQVQQNQAGQGSITERADAILEGQ